MNIYAGGRSEAALNAMDRPIESIAGPECCFVRDRIPIEKWLKNNNNLIRTLYIC